MEEKIRQSVEEFYREYPTLPRTEKFRVIIGRICEDFLDGFEPEIIEGYHVQDIVFYATDLPLYDIVENNIGIHPCGRLLRFLNNEIRNHFPYENGEDEHTHQVRILLQIAYGDEPTIETARKAYESFC